MRLHRQVAWRTWEHAWYINIIILIRYLRFYGVGDDNDNVLVGFGAIWISSEDANFLEKHTISMETVQSVYCIEGFEGNFEQQFFTFGR
jgi:hypothetical protein